MEALIFALLVAGVAGRRTLSDIPFMVRGQTPPSHERRMTEMAHRETAANRRHQRRMTRVQRPHPARAYWSALWGHAWQRAAEKRRDRWEVRDPVKAQRYRDKLQGKLDGTYRGPARRTLDRGKALHEHAKRTARGVTFDVVDRAVTDPDTDYTETEEQRAADRDAAVNGDRDSSEGVVHAHGKPAATGPVMRETIDENGQRVEIVEWPDGSEVGIYPDNLDEAAEQTEAAEPEPVRPPTRNLHPAREGIPSNYGQVDCEWCAAEAKLKDTSNSAGQSTETPSPNGTSERNTMSTAPSEATGVDEFRAALEQMTQQLDGLVPACEGLAASAQQQQVGPSVTDPLARAQEMAPQLVACFEQSREGLQQSVNVGESYAANQDAGDAAFVTNGARS